MAKLTPQTDNVKVKIIKRLQSENLTDNQIGEIMIMINEMSLALICDQQSAISKTISKYKRRFDI